MQGLEDRERATAYMVAFKAALEEQPRRGNHKIDVKWDFYRHNPNYNSVFSEPGGQKAA